MKSYGNLDMNENKLARFAIEAESNFPETPIPGRVVFKDKKLYFCVEVLQGVPAWIPVTTEIDTFIHHVHSSAPSTTWTITHNLNSTCPLVQIYDTTQHMVIPDEVVPVDNNTTTVHFGWPMAGRAVLMIGNEREGATRSVAAYEYAQVTPSTSWTLEHDLGYNPIVRVFVGQAEVQPDTVVHTDVFTTVITFSAPTAGVATCA